jgi:hypothetical protein
MATNGGKRQGAGRPKGSTNVPRFANYVTEEDRKTFAEFMMSTYMGDMGVAKWVGDHLFRKPPQDLGDGEGGTLGVEGVTIKVRERRQNS